MTHTEPISTVGASALNIMTLDKLFIFSYGLNCYQRVKGDLHINIHSLSNLSMLTCLMLMGRKVMMTRKPTGYSETHLNVFLQ